MPVSSLDGLTRNATAQTLADFALQEWQAARRARARGDMREAQEREREAFALCDRINGK